MKMLLSCISTQHSLLKQHWEKSREEIACPVTVLGSFQKPKDNKAGLLSLLDESGRPQQAAALPSPTGMVRSADGRVLVATATAIHRLEPDLSAVEQDAVTLPLFNVLHSLSRTQRGYLVASTGVDALAEFDEAGNLLWDWWATDHGFTMTPVGVPRVLDKTVDQRAVKYGTLEQTTHVNSVAELPDGRILATLFHQGSVIIIDRESGTWQTVLEGLNHPHAVRILDEQHFTVADTGNGRALLVSLVDSLGRIVLEVKADTDWLQDCQYSERDDCWFLVDGKNSRILLYSGISGYKPAERIDLDPEWRLYELLLL
ncbi:MAG TPA: hypothetical protein VFN35_02940 [Ktedonobacteraceae bacterium]|nr:hypothetical protein [Ktedonobacteraceae bacterium]